MQNLTNSRTPRFSTRQRNMAFPLDDIELKVATCTKYEIKACILLHKNVLT